MDLYFCSTQNLLADLFYTSTQRRIGNEGNEKERNSRSSDGLRNYKSSSINETIA